MFGGQYIEIPTNELVSQERLVLRLALWTLFVGLWQVYSVECGKYDGIPSILLSILHEAGAGGLFTRKHLSLRLACYSCPSSGCRAELIEVPYIM